MLWYALIRLCKSILCRCPPSQTLLGSSIGLADTMTPLRRRESSSNPTYYPAHVCLGLAYEQKHEFSLSVAELKSATGFCRDKCFGLIGQVSALSRDRAGALEALRQLRRRPYVSPWLVAIVYTELGERARRSFGWKKRTKAASMISPSRT
jgi:hypothetical protein